MSQRLLRSDTVIYDAATQCPVDELVLTFHLVYRHSSVCQFPARLYLGHSRTPHHWSQRSLTERRSCKHIVNLSGVKGSQADGRHMAPTNRSCNLIPHYGRAGHIYRGLVSKRLRVILLKHGHFCDMEVENLV